MRLEHQIENVHRTRGNGSPRSKHTYDTVVVQSFVISRRDHASCHNHDVGAATFTQGIEQAWNKCQMTGSKRTHANHVDIIFNGLTRHLFRCAEQRSKVHVKSKIGER